MDHLPLVLGLRQPGNALAGWFQHEHLTFVDPLFCHMRDHDIVLSHRPSVLRGEHFRSGVLELDRADKRKLREGNAEFGLRQQGRALPIRRTDPHE